MMALVISDLISYCTPTVLKKLYRRNTADPGAIGPAMESLFKSWGNVAKLIGVENPLPLFWNGLD